MRIRNKELRARRQRKEKAIKSALREIRANAPEKKAGATAPKPKPTVKKATASTKSAAKPAAKAKKSESEG